MSEHHSKSNAWDRCTSKNPCPVCKHDGWCQVKADGTVCMCMREATGSFRDDTDRSGARYYLHRLRPDPVPASVTPTRATDKFCHEVYSRLLQRSWLSDFHREQLRKRGLLDDEIEQRGYKTHPGLTRCKIVRQLCAEFGDAIGAVPGIVWRESPSSSYWSLSGKDGLLIPARNSCGLIVALLYRPNKNEGAKYLWMTSKNRGGPSPGAQCHVPLFPKLETGLTVRITEGALKADLATVQSGILTLGVAGTGSWKPVQEILKQLQPSAVHVAYDADWKRKPEVAGSLLALLNWLRNGEIQ